MIKVFLHPLDFFWFIAFLAAILACTGDLAQAQDDLVTQKKIFWDQWRGAMEKGEQVRASDMARSNRVLALGVANDVGNHTLEIFKKGDKKVALFMFQLLGQLYHQLDDDHGIAVSEQNIGSVYLDSGDCRSALPAFARAAERYEKINYKPGRERTAKDLGTCARAIAQSDTSLKSIVNLRVVDGVEVIVVHPALCMQIGAEVCEFYILHEYAHIYLGHVAQNKPWEEGEIEADCWAAKYGQRHSAIAAYDWFLSAPTGISPLSHKSNELRAERIRACARF